MKESKVRVVIADGHPVVQFALTHAFERIEGVDVVGVARNSTDLMPLLQTRSCDVLLMDFYMPNGLYGDGIPLLTRLRRKHPELRIVLLTSLAHSSTLQLVRALGIRCILSKADQLECLPLAIRAANQEDEYLSPKVTSLFASEISSPRRLPALSEREERVLKLYNEGFTVGQISLILQRSIKTVSQQKCSGKRKLGFTSELDLVKFLRATFKPGKRRSAADARDLAV
ncbi:response regulator [Pseudomonas aeruginosa]